jgi:hypothetical protein
MYRDGVDVRGSARQTKSREARTRSNMFVACTEVGTTSACADPIGDRWIDFVHVTGRRTVSSVTEQS